MHEPSFVVAQPIEPRAAPPRMSARAVMHALFRRKWLILLVFVTCSVAGWMAAGRLTTLKYEASAQLLVSPADVALPTDAAGSARGAGADEQVARAVRLLVGRVLAEQVVRSIGPTTLYPRLAQSESADERLQVMRATDRLTNDLSAQSVGRSSIVAIYFVHEDPEMAARVVNTIGELYVERHARVQKNPRSDSFLKEQLAVLERKLGDSQVAFEAFKRQHGVTVAPRDERDLAFSELTATRSSLADTQGRQQELESQIAELRRRMGGEAQIPRMIYQLQERVSELEVQESELAQRVTDQHPSLRDLREQLRRTRERLKQYDNAQPFGSAAVRDQSYVLAQSELTRNQAELESVKARQVSLAAKAGLAKRRLDALEAIDGEFNRLQSQVRADEQTYRAYLSKVESAQVAQAMEEQRIVGVRMIEPAQAPLAPLNPDAERRIRLMGIVLGLVGGVGLALVLKWFGNRVETSEDVEREIGLPVLTSIGLLRLS